LDKNNEEEVVVLNTRIREEVSANPSLACELYVGQWSLLHYALDAASQSSQMAELYVSTIKVLVEAYPSALLYTSLAKPAPLVRPWPYEKNIIHEIAAHRELCKLMPWIATNFPSILDDEVCLEQPPIFALFEKGTCAVVKEFLEAHPQSHYQVDEDGSTPLHKALEPHVLRIQQDAGFIQWMCEANPSSLLKITQYGMTPLHNACATLESQGFDDNDTDENILKVIINACPGSIRRPNSQGHFPIYFLLESLYEHPKALVAMLREYPESLEITWHEHHDRDWKGGYSHDEFFRPVKPCVDDLRDLKDNIFHLQVITMFFDKAVTCTNNELVRSVSEVFDSWTTDLTKVLEQKVEDVSSQLLQTCLEQQWWKLE